MEDVNYLVLFPIPGEPLVSRTFIKEMYMWSFILIILFLIWVFNRGPKTSHQKRDCYRYGNKVIKQDCIDLPFWDKDGKWVGPPKN